MYNNEAAEGEKNVDAKLGGVEFDLHGGKELQWLIKQHLLRENRRSNKEIQ